MMRGAADGFGLVYFCGCTRPRNHQGAFCLTVLSGGDDGHP
jgi:hypothetical protein